MEKYQLAQQLRQRQYHLGILEKPLIDALSDNEIIDCYITCSCCGGKQVSSQGLATAIGQATNTDQFFEFCDSLTHARSAAVAAPQNVRSTAKGRRRG